MTRRRPSRADPDAPPRVVITRTDGVWMGWCVRCGWERTHRDRMYLDALIHTHRDTLPSGCDDAIALQRVQAHVPAPFRQWEARYR